MEIGQFEKAFRAAMGNSLMRPALAAPAEHGQIGLPPEFEAARDSLASRSIEQARDNSLLHAVAAQWS